ncbi:transcriptional adapter ADA2-like isoform X3 [Andrographis paniculata]|uniref:transcriptional adapter ADA2-like isoform X3 n=1 Tax=Andrographis paniculata TaxID=175694 RepID=UPI0021E989BC|nr:transcriptional adapter ADA2-like isoform X3 [Andrographis paniculata]
MGRSRAVTQAAVDDPGHSRSKRKRTAQNVENTESATPEVPGINDGKKALYHCNYCNKDISGKIRIKCVICSDFDLCVECFSVGAEVHPHKSNHPYRVMDNLAFPLICPDWNADEEMLLLEGIEMYGLGNWNEVAEHVGTKSKSQCIDHYNKIYMNSPCFPLPDMSRVMGKNREELLAMAKEQSEYMKGTGTCGDVEVKEETHFSARIKLEEPKIDGQPGRSSSSVSSEQDTIRGCKISMGASERTTSNVLNNDGLDAVKLEEFPSDRSIGEKKPRTSSDEGVSLKELSGYNSKRQEFEIEYDNEAEQLLADMEFKEIDTEAERDLKLRILHIYSKRLDERKRRKEFILERNLLYPDPFEKELTSEEKELCRRYRVFMRFHTKEEHGELLRYVVEEQRILKRIQGLQEARAAGCRTSAEAERYIEQKLKREAEENARRVKESSQAGPSGKYLQRMSHQKGEVDTSSPRVGNKSPSVLDPSGKDSLSSTIAKGPTGSEVSDNWDVTGFLGVDLLSEAEKQLCEEIKILPTHYLNMLQTLSMGVLNGSVTKKSDAHGLFTVVDPGKVDRVYDMLIRKGIAQT